MKAKWINESVLKWPDVWNHLYMKKNEDTSLTNWMWKARPDTPNVVIEFLRDFGLDVQSEKGYTTCGFGAATLATLLLNKGFAKYLVLNDPALAIKIGIATEVAKTKTKTKKLPLPVADAPQVMSQEELDVFACGEKLPF